MTRLTNEYRDRIVKNAVGKKGIFERQALLYSDRADWAERCRLESLGGEAVEAQLLKSEKKVEAIHATIPEKVREDRSCRVLVNRSSRLFANFAGCSYNVDFGKRKPVARSGMHDRYAFAADHPLTVEFHRLNDAENALTEEEHAVRQAVRTVVHKVNTVKQLLEVWPEVKEILPPPPSGEPASTLPVIPVENLNALLGLPTEPAAQ